MAAEGQILTSEILKDDNLDALIAKMRSLETVVESLTTAIHQNKLEAGQLEAATKNLNTATSSGREQIVKNTRATDALEQANNRYNQSLSTNAKQLAEVRAKITEQNRLNKLETQLTNAKAGSYNALSAQYSLNVQRLNAMSTAERRLTNEGQALTKSTAAIRAEMTRLQSELGNNTLKVGSYENAIGGLKTRFTDFIKGGFIVSGVMAISNAIGNLGRTILQQKVEISDSIADIQRIGQLSAGEANDIFNAVKNLDTRTATNELLKLTAIGTRLGVSKTELVGFTSALDSLKVALGSELGEDVEVVATRLGKLANIFGDDKNITGDEILRIGNAIVDLANKGVASGEFLSDFSQRLAGISGIAKVTLPQSLGLGAALEELGQSAEVGGTAVTQLVLKLGQDVPKYAKLAGKSAEEFGETLNENPIEALVQLAQGISTNKKSFAELSEAFKDAEARGVRVTAILGVIGKNANFVREKIGDATIAYQNFNQITDAVRIKQQSFAAILEKAGKAITGIFNDSILFDFFKGGLIALTEFANGIGRLLDPIGTLKNEFDATQKNVTRLEKELPTLLGRYDELKSKTRPTADEQRELGDVIKRVGELTPTAIIEVDKYGNALSINAQKSRDFLKAEKARLAFINKDLIENLQLQIATAEQQIAARRARIRVGSESTLSGSGFSVAGRSGLSEEQVRKLQAEIAAYSQEVEGATAQLNFLKTGSADASSELDLQNDIIKENTDEFTKNTAAKKDNLTAAEKLAIAANKELQYQRELQELLAKDSGLPLLQELSGGNADQASDKFYSIGRNVGAAFGEGLGDAKPLQNIFDANAEKDVKERMAKLVKASNDSLEAGVGERTGIFQRLADGESIYDLLGVNVDDEEKAAIKSSFDFAKQQLTEFLSFRTQIANRNVQNADREVQSAQEALNNQIALQAAGLANTVESRQRDLADAQANREKALKQQEKAAKQEQLISGSQQAVNMALALSKLFATNPILAIGLGALVIGSFVGFKVAAAQASKRQYGQGDYQVLEGGSHASGNDTFLGTHDSEGRPEYGEFGEARMIIPKGATSKYRSILPEIFQALKEKDFENQFQRIGKSSQGIPLIVNVGGGNTISTGRMERTLEMIHRQGQEKTILDGKGRLVTTYKNLVQIREN